MSATGSGPFFSAEDVNNANNINVNANSNASSKNKRGSKFNFDSYYEKQVSKQQCLREKQYQEQILSSSKLVNSCVLLLQYNTKVSAHKLVTIIKSSLSPEEFDSILQVGKFGSAKKWLITFKEQTAFNSAIGKVITIDNNQFQMYNANDAEKINSIETKIVKMTAFLRVHWLSKDVSDQEISDFISEQIKGVSVNNIRRETFKSIKNGVVNVKITYELAKNQDVLDFIGLHRISGRQTLIHLSGMPPKCLGCKKLGHIRKQCEKCTICNKFGHNAQQCSLANRTAPQEPIPQELLDVDQQDVIVDNAAPESTPGNQSGDHASKSTEPAVQPLRNETTVEIAQLDHAPI
jgi:hypothetical protein